MFEFVVGQVARSLEDLFAGVGSDWGSGSLDIMLPLRECIALCVRDQCIQQQGADGMESVGVW